MSKIEEALKKVASQRASSSTKKEVRESSVPDDQFVKKTTQNEKKEKFSQLLDVPPIEIDNLMISTAKDEKSEIVEEYNKLRSTVIALTTGEAFSNTLMITSTVSEEGKTMTAINLAISLAKEHDHTVLLVDTDFRRPSVHKYLGVEPKVGLVHCLRDNLPIEKALIKTGIGKLVVLPAGEPVRDPVELLSSNRMKEVILELKQRYAERYVIFDTPPAMPFADAGVIAASIDAILYVVREGKAKRQDILSTLAELKAHNLLGVVFNDAHSFNKKESMYYYYR